jgi:hypothetical protein
LLWPNSFLAFIADAGETDIVFFALCVLIFSIALLVITVFSLIKKLRPGRVFLHRLPLFFISFLILLGFTSYAGTKPAVCESCHVMQPAVRDLGYTKHNSIGCMSCHKKANILGLPIQDLSQASMVLNYLRGTYSRPVSATISNDICLECHGDIKQSVKSFGRIRVSHKEMIKERILCTECHDDIAHRKQYVCVSMMERCSGCHNGEKASARCRTCHLDKVKLGVLPTGDWSIVHDKNWPDLHGTRGTNACIFCHEKKYCGKCHATVVPHPEGWSYIHGDEAVTNRNDCKICHKDESFCTACHKVEMPHPVSWLSVHSLKIKAVGEKPCESCHKKKDCVNCHKNHEESIGKMKKAIR